LWYLQPQSPSTVAERAMEAILRRDAQTLFAYSCAEERERITVEQLQRILNTIHDKFPEMRRLSGTPIAYRPPNLGNIVPSDYCFMFFFKTTDNQLVACSEKEIEQIMSQ